MRWYAACIQRLHAHQEDLPVGIRWHFVLGVVLGAVLMTVFLRQLEKVYKKIYTRKKKDFPQKS